MASGKMLALVPIMKLGRSVVKELHHVPQDSLTQRSRIRLHSLS